MARCVKDSYTAERNQVSAALGVQTTVQSMVPDQQLSQGRTGTDLQEAIEAESAAVQRPGGTGRAVARRSKAESDPIPRTVLAPAADVVRNLKVCVAVEAG
ncbi:uncharacterized protein Z520_05372 [Fonsecaea multimorphosa CBS 102226]|uniref:Uncharacterized protein n=1 Tax=Fonsecaea multimorphosa CBS 102226 TaxID=1442371 RepID=A0A0D2IPS5_9EURO|nr:uncharacterized protein Z520_05372 [Fonsecaea multimorphosa CBS 102226]KIX98911.1 hypothetical protein Z520_05372 [Fonsecaea multimorphosa CBS 102226]